MNGPAASALAVEQALRAAGVGGTLPVDCTVMAEFLPADLRATGMGTAGAMARFGGLLAPSIVAPVMASRFMLSLALLSSLLVVSAIAIGMVDVESRNRALD